MKKQSLGLTARRLTHPDVLFAKGTGSNPNTCHFNYIKENIPCFERKTRINELLQRRQGLLSTLDSQNPNSRRPDSFQLPSDLHTCAVHPQAPFSLQSRRSLRRSRAQSNQRTREGEQCRRCHSIQSQLTLEPQQQPSMALAQG